MNLHRHSAYSTYDGLGTPRQAALRAKELGQPALALTDHGNVSGLVEHFLACEEVGIRPVLGVEAYFVPVFDEQRLRADRRAYYHLCLFAMNQTGYHNLMQLITEANRERFYQRPHVDWELLQQFHEGLIVTSGCLSGWIPRLIQRQRMDKAIGVAQMFRALLGDRFYLEVQPYSAEHQAEVNARLIEVGRVARVPVVLTADSHYVAPEEYGTHRLKFLVSGRDEIADYTDRHMPTGEEVAAHWQRLMGTDATAYIERSVEIAERCEVDMRFPELIPKLQWGKPSKLMLLELAKQGLRQRACDTAEYRARLAEELGVVFQKGFEDYFLLCYDIVQYAKRQGIGVGLGRGSVCGSLLAYAIGLTEVDPLRLHTYFERFLRPDKNVLPDIDIDFESNRRDEVIQYIMQRFDGKVAQISTFGYYRVKNLVNELARAYTTERQAAGDTAFGFEAADLEKLKRILERALENGEEGEADWTLVLSDPWVQTFQERYPDFLVHFRRLYGQPAYMGRHAAGVAISAQEISRYVALRRDRGQLQTSYDLESLKHVGVVKMDELGLAQVSIFRDIEKATGETFRYEMIEDPKVYEAFSHGDTLGIFQFEKRGAIDILKKVRPQNIQELIACNALNRPAPIQLGVVDEYIRAKQEGADTTTPWYPYTQDAYGCILYQEHVMQICRHLAGLPWDQTDKIMKSLRQVHDRVGEDPLREAFLRGAKAVGKLEEAQAEQLYDRITLYSFNKGHATAYTLMAVYAMWLRLYHPLEFWWAMVKNETKPTERELYRMAAVGDRVLLLLPHVNGGAEPSIRLLEDGEAALQDGLVSIDGVGRITAQAIAEQAPYQDWEDLVARVPRRHLNSKIQEILKDQGAVEFRQREYYRRVWRWNIFLMTRFVAMARSLGIERADLVEGEGNSDAGTSKKGRSAKQGTRSRRAGRAGSGDTSAQVVP